jgi:hypothetical protein
MSTMRVSKNQDRPFVVGEKVLVSRRVRTLVRRLSVAGVWLLDKPVDRYRQWEEKEMRHLESEDA